MQEIPLKELSERLEKGAVAPPRIPVTDPILLGLIRKLVTTRWPEWNTVRMVLSDWLEENNHPEVGKWVRTAGESWAADNVIPVNLMITNPHWEEDYEAAWRGIGPYTDVFLRKFSGLDKQLYRVVFPVFGTDKVRIASEQWVEESAHSWDCFKWRYMLPAKGKVYPPDKALAWVKRWLKHCLPNFREKCIIVPPPGLE